MEIRKYMKVRWDMPDGYFIDTLAVTRPIKWQSIFGRRKIEFLRMDGFRQSPFGESTLPKYRAPLYTPPELFARQCIKALSKNYPIKCTQIQFGQFYKRGKDWIGGFKIEYSYYPHQPQNRPLSVVSQRRK